MFILVKCASLGGNVVINTEQIVDMVFGSDGLWYCMMTDRQTIAFTDQEVPCLFKALGINLK